MAFISTEADNIIPNGDNENINPGLLNEEWRIRQTGEINLNEDLERCGLPDDEILTIFQKHVNNAMNIYDIDLIPERYKTEFCRCGLLYAYKLKIYIDVYWRIEDRYDELKLHITKKQRKEIKDYMEQMKSHEKMLTDEYIGIRCINCVNDNCRYYICKKNCVYSVP